MIYTIQTSFQKAITTNDNDGVAVWSAHDSRGDVAEESEGAQQGLDGLFSIYYYSIFDKKKKKNAQRSGRSMAIIRNRTIKLEVLCC